MIHDLEKVSVPAWYELSVKDEKTLLISIHVMAMDYMKKVITPDIPIVKGFTDSLSRCGFCVSLILPGIEKPWGFGEILVPCKSEDCEWVNFECLVPILKGSGGYTNALALRSTLSLLFRVLRLFQGDTGSKKPQFMVVNKMSVEEDLFGGSINMILTPTVSKFLSKQINNSRLIDVEETMMTTNMYMWNKVGDRFLRRAVQVLCRQPKWINFSVPGNACGLDPDGYGDKTMNGYTLYPHNVDGSTQQLTLLFGLAKLQDLVRRDLNV